MPEFLVCAGFLASLSAHPGWKTCQSPLNTGLDDFIAKSTPIRAVAGDLFNTAYGNGWYYFADKSANTPETYGICFFLNINSWSFRLAIGTSKFAYTNVNIGQGFGTWLKL